MKKQDLLKYFDDDLLDKLFGFCYARTNDSYEAEELCSDIIYALVKAAHSDGEIESIYPFIWRVARNVYADFSNNRRKHAETLRMNLLLISIVVIFRGANSIWRGGFGHQPTSLTTQS